jgi:hypothetical protein
MAFPTGWTKCSRSKKQPTMEVLRINSPVRTDPYLTSLRALWPGTVLGKLFEREMALRFQLDAFSARSVLLVFRLLFYATQKISLL